MRKDLQANELRIGNCIHHERIGNPCKYVNHRVISDIASNPYNHEYTPISISLEWHMRFGAKEINKRRFAYELSNGAAFIFNYDIVKECWWVEYRNKSYDLSMPIEMNYVHELQNFWRFNTGKELEIKQ